MSSVKHMLFVRSTRPPIVEIDAESGGVYVRFSDKAVAKTLERQRRPDCHGRRWPAGRHRGHRGPVFYRVFIVADIATSERKSGPDWFIEGTF